MLVGF
jgi:hypothetical protein